MGCVSFSGDVGVSPTIYKRQGSYIPPSDIGEITVIMITKETPTTPLGVVLFVDSEDEYTNIVRLKDSGVIPEYNAQHPTQQLRKGDQIISVNGFGGLGQTGYETILSELRKPGRMHMAVRRTDRTTSTVTQTGTQDETDWVDKLPHAFAADCSSQLCSACEDIIADDCEVLNLSCGHVIHLECARKHMQPCRRLVEATCIECRKRQDQDRTRLAKPKAKLGLKRTNSSLRSAEIVRPAAVPIDPDGEAPAEENVDKPFLEKAVSLNIEASVSALKKESTKDSTKSFGRSMREMTFTCPALKTGLPDGGIHDLNPSHAKIEFILRRVIG